MDELIFFLGILFMLFIKAGDGNGKKSPAKIEKKYHRKKVSDNKGNAFPFGKARRESIKKNTIGVRKVDPEVNPVTHIDQVKSVSTVSSETQMMRKEKIDKNLLNTIKAWRSDDVASASTKLLSKNDTSYCSSLSGKETMVFDVEYKKNFICESYGVSLMYKKRLGIVDVVVGYNTLGSFDVRAFHSQSLGTLSEEIFSAILPAIEKNATFKTEILNDIADDIIKIRITVSDLNGEKTQARSSTLYYSEAEQPSIEDGISSGRYISCSFFRKLVTRDGYEAIWLFSIEGNDKIFAVACRDSGILDRYLELGKEYLIDSLELSHNGLKNHLFYNDEINDLNWSEICYSSNELRDIFAGPHSYNYKELC